MVKNTRLTTVKIVEQMASAQVVEMPYNIRTDIDQIKSMADELSDKWAERDQKFFEKNKLFYSKEINDKIEDLVELDDHIRQLYHEILDDVERNHDGFKAGTYKPTEAIDPMFELTYEDGKISYMLLSQLENDGYPVGVVCGTNMSVISSPEARKKFVDLCMAAPVI